MPGQVKQVFRIGRRVFWRSNGMEIRYLWYLEYKEDGHVIMHRFNKRPLRVEMVDPPSGRCPHCGGKL